MESYPVATAPGTDFLRDATRRKLLARISPDQTNAINSGDFVFAGGLKPNRDLLFVLQQLLGNLVLHIEESTGRAANWDALDCLLADALSVRQNFKGALTMLFAEIGSYDCTRVRRFNRKVV